MSESTVDSPLRRLHRELVQALRERDPAGLSRPFTVAEIYQDLVPYRTHRDVLGVDMNGDYEHLLLRLLAGEGDLVTLESEHARRELIQELARSNPNTGLFRDYAAVDVHLVAARIPAEAQAAPGGASYTAVILPANGGAPEWPDEAPGTEDEDDAPPVGELAPDEEGDMSEAKTGPAGAGKRPGDDGACYWCRGALPERENLNFCPFCGTDVSVVPCGSCGEAVEPGWRFCIQCGAPSGEG